MHHISIIYFIHFHVNFMPLMTVFIVFVLLLFQDIGKSFKVWTNIFNIFWRTNHSYLNLTSVPKHRVRKRRNSDREHYIACGPYSAACLIQNTVWPPCGNATPAHRWQSPMWPPCNYMALVCDSGWPSLDLLREISIPPMPLHAYLHTWVTI